MILETKRLKLCLPKIGSEEQILSFYKENDKFLSPWDPEKPGDFFELSYWKSKIEMAHEEYQEKNSLRLNLYLKDSEELVGMTNFTNFERGPFQNCRLGYKLGEKFQGKGLMQEALQSGINYIFKDLLIHRIEANYIPHNIKSGKVLKALGFVEHGLAKDYLKIDGKWQDHHLTSKLNPNTL